MAESDLEYGMRRALEQAHAAQELGEVPVGAVVLRAGQLVAEAHNRTEIDGDPTAHAEILALRAAADSLGDWRLNECTLVVTLEPCPMCLGAIVMARVGALAYGARDERFGACGSAVELLPFKLTPHLREVRHAIAPEPCLELLQGFFQRLRGQRDGSGSE